MSVWNMKLCALTLLVVLSGCIAVDFRRPTKVQMFCCEKVSKGFIPPEIKLTRYKYQNALSPCVDAVIFFTDSEMYCVDPTARWIKRKITTLKETK